MLIGFPLVDENLSGQLSRFLKFLITHRLGDVMIFSISENLMGFGGLWSSIPQGIISKIIPTS
jgi:hypothetical protein